MDTHVSNDPQNPINWNGTEDIICTLCHNILTDNELEQNGDDPNPYCEECTEEQEELANIERETLNEIFDAFSSATINTIK